MIRDFILCYDSWTLIILCSAIFILTIMDKQLIVEMTAVLSISIMISIVLEIDITITMSVGIVYSTVDWLIFKFIPYWLKVWKDTK